ncbi:hypothetical protein MSAN_00001500 [Mycena sanguinolenta]|uniref:Transcription activator of gluconeogenesis ERT1 n=1 Tax=Mycena sanguinolenta TaxID=230812 RepID=A0A8H6ZFD7_9AGAR|nr:hypothetical protein MSAN_00001500 [Mycena sanguinolenta]
MASSNEMGANGSDDIFDSPSTNDTPLHMHSFASASQTVRLRRQVKIACTKCQKAGKKCDLARPCLRCTKYRFPEECVDAERKERKRGGKRGPYRKRDANGNIIGQNNDFSQEVKSDTSSPPSDPPLSTTMAGSTEVGYASAQSLLSSNGDPYYPYPQFYFPPVPPPVGERQGGENSTFHSHHDFYMAAYVQPPHIEYASPDGQIFYCPPVPDTEGDYRSVGGLP